MNANLKGGSFIIRDLRSQLQNMSCKRHVTMLLGLEPDKSVATIGKALVVRVLKGDLKATVW